MPDTTVLHIQTDDSSLTRVLELAGPAVRIGRGTQCEVHLVEPELAEVQCMLRRRGETWHVQPVGPPGRVSLDGRALNAQRPLPLGVPLRVGDHLLTLRPADGILDGIGSFGSPIPVETVDEERTVSPEPFARASSSRTESPTSLDAERERLERWQARLEQRERWLKARADERRWEARWKAAGANLKAGSAPVPTARTTTPEPPPRRRSASPVDSSGRANKVDAEAPPPTSGDGLVASPPAAPPIPTEPLAPRQESLDARAPDEAPGDPPRAFEPGRMSKGQGPVVTTVLAEPSARAKAESDPAGRVVSSTIVLPKTPSSPTEPVPSPAPSLGVSSRPPVSPPAPPTVSGLGVSQQIPGITWRDVRMGDSAGSGNAPRGSLGVSTEPLIGPRPAQGRSTNRPESDLGHSSSSTPLTPQSRPLDGIEWPSARAIFEAHPRGSRTSSATATSKGRRPASRAASTRPLPTRSQAPEYWTLPFWMCWTSASAAFLAVGLVGIGLAWTWALDDYTAGIVANRLLRNAPTAADKARPALILESEPDASWWHSSAGHLFLWALSRESGVTDPERAEQARFYLEAARKSSPVHPGVRYALAHRASRPRPASELAQSLGVSRDVIAMAGAGRRLLEAGRLDAALQLFGDALDMAARADLAELDPPEFHEDAGVRRYALPYEDLMGEVIRAMASHRGWTFRRWSSVLRSSAVAPLAAARILREQGRAEEAERALDLVLERAKEPAGEGSSPAVQIAAEAEALALRGRWRQAEQGYQQAIESMPVDDIRRSWWMNLADLYSRLNEDANKRKAWEAARGPNPREEVSSRAVRAQTQAGIGLADAKAWNPAAASPAPILRTAATPAPSLPTPKPRNSSPRADR